MKILNLTDEKNTEIYYKISSFPDGQHQVDLLAVNGFSHLKGENVQIRTRLRNFIDLEILICAVASLRGVNVGQIHLFVSYFMGARSDRKFKAGGNNYLKAVICPIINAIGFDSVLVLDPHSTCLEMGLNSFDKIDNSELVDFALDNMPLNAKNIVFVAPDAGASHKIYDVAKNVEFTGPIITCTKERNAKGEIIATVVPVTPAHQMKSFVIIDDICDGGRTFIEIAKKLIETLTDERIEKIYLVVTHGIFSAGFDELSQYFDGIYCTNSYSDVTAYTDSVLEKTFVKRLKVI